MGFYADESIESGFERHWDEHTRRYPDNVVPRNFVHLPNVDAGRTYEDFPEGTELLVRKFDRHLNKLVFNRVCMVMRRTEKAVLFKVDRGYNPNLDKDFLFWMPKANIYMMADEKAVVYIKYWATIKNIV